MQNTVLDAYKVSLSYGMEVTDINIENEIERNQFFEPNIRENINTKNQYWGDTEYNLATDYLNFVYENED